MDKQRYLVIIVRPPSETTTVSPGRRASLLVPFSPDAIISTFIDELWKRLARHDGAIPLTSETHHVILHLEHEDGPVIDAEDLLSDVINDTQKEKIFAVFSRKRNNAPEIQATRVHIKSPSKFNGLASPANAVLVQVVPILTQTSVHDEDSLSFRVITTSTTRTRDSCPILKIPTSATVRQLHLSIANTIGCTSPPEETVEARECNCTLAKDLALGPSDPTHFLVIHGKSAVEKLPLEVATVGCLQQALFSRFGQDLEISKKISYHGATQDPDDSRNYTKTPVVSLCSKQRHVPTQARVDLDGSDRIRPQVLDLHTTELPIHPACFDSTIEALGLGAVAVDGIVDIFAVLRSPSAESPILRGKSATFRDLAHWEPSTAQSDRGMAMFLSSLRVFASVVQDMQSEQSAQDAVYYAFDELTQFPPALRCLHILVSGQTPTTYDCAALSQSFFEVLRTHMELDAIAQDPSRLFEGSRLAFGYILQAAKSLCRTTDDSLPGGDEEANQLRYIPAFHTYDIRDHKTHEPVLHAIQTSSGLVEAELFRSLQDGGILAETHLQSFLFEVEVDPRMSRFALQSGGTCPEVIVSSLRGLRDSYSSQPGAPRCALDLEPLRDLLHLAELCGRNGLAVHGPSQLVSAVAPCLTFDRNAHVAVYTGEQPCAQPGHSSIIFRPQHGEETIDPSVLEQLIAPIIKTYEQDGSAVFDVFGGAEVRRMQDPDEIIMFCVDSSASMLGATDFGGVNDHTYEPSRQSYTLAEDERHNALSFEESKDRLLAHESFEDMLAIIATTSERRKDWMTRKVLTLLTSLLCSKINKKEKALETERGSAFGPVWRTRISGLESDLQATKAFRASLKVHEEALTQFLRFRASRLDLEAAKRWTWSVGDPVPADSESTMIPMLPYDITEVPSYLRCPISHKLMEDAVEASDGQTYSRSAIQQWFAIRKTSPLHGAPLDDLSLTARPDVRGEVASWIYGATAANTSDVVTLTFDSRVGSFTRTISRTTSSRDLYRLAYRGLQAKFEAFQLSVREIGALSMSGLSVLSMGLKDSDHIMVRIPEETDILRVGSRGAPMVRQNEVQEMCLVKVFQSSHRELFGFWVPRATTDSLATLIWKYWRYRLRTMDYTEPQMREITTNIRNLGDGWYTAQTLDETESLALYLTRGHCTGKLEPEDVFTRDTSNLGSQSNHKVLKVMIATPDEDPLNHRLTRLDVLKQMFEALINRMLAYNYKNHVGLVKFSSHAQVVMPISHVLENFRRATSELEGGGDTALWDALALAGDQIEQYASRFPNAKKRIVVISDGRDTKSTANTSHGIASNLLRKGISTDSVSLGNDDNTDLRTLSYLLGSYRFHPESLTNALAICEMEPFLSLSQRPPIALPIQNLAYLPHMETRFYMSRRWAMATLVTGDTVPPIREHPNLGDDFVQLTAFASRGNATGTGVNARAGAGPGRSRLRVPRLMNEIRTIAARGVHSKYDIYISTADVSFWKIVVEGPDGSPYSDGAFLLYLHADDDYPRLAPRARFVTKIKHPNVNAHGRICHSIFDRDWTSDTSMGVVLDTIYGLLYQPEHSDPVNTTTTLGFFHDPVEFAEEARKHAQRHAAKTREEWRAEILDE